MKIYTVGGAVRDELLGLPVHDHDHVVVGATPEDMVAQGFRPVGKDFPVFLHPVTQEEYALARTERKTSPGYRGFVFHTDTSVTLEHDLARRDLTINAIARAEDGRLIDPFDGCKDLKARIFRHVSSAFVEDPVRILRVARFAARFVDFSVAQKTMQLMHDMVRQGEVDALVPERIWQEAARGLMEQKPSRMFSVLRDCDALSRLLPELDALWSVPPQEGCPVASCGLQAMLAVDEAAQRGYALTVRFAVLLCDVEKGMSLPTQQSDGNSDKGGAALVATLCSRLKVPTDCRDMARIIVREHGSIEHALELSPVDVVDLLVRCDAFRKPMRFLDILSAVECSRCCFIPADTGSCFPQRERLAGALHAAQSVNAGAIAVVWKETPQKIPSAIYQARSEAVAVYFSIASKSS